MGLFVVEAISMFRMRYVIEAEEASHAEDEVVMNEHRSNFAEFSQKHLGEIITMTREITEEEYKQLLATDHGCNSWMGDQLIHRVE